MRSEKLRRLRQNANEMQGQEVRLVYNLLVPQQLILVIIRRLDYPKHLLDYGAREVASSSQLQSTGFGCSLKHDQRIGRDRRSGDFRIGEVGFESDRVVTTRGPLTKSIQAVEFEHRPGRFDAIQPSTNLGVLEESWCNHTSPDTGLGIRGLPDWLSTAPIAESSAVSNRHHHQDLIGSRRIGDRDRDRIEMREGPGIIFVPTRYVDQSTRSGHLYIRADHRFSAADRGAHRFARWSIYRL
jgi:hypothetical protein